MSGKLKDRIALITGASKGIGAAVAKRYAEEGAHVILIARTLSGLEEVDDQIQNNTGGQATLVPMDLHDHDKIDALAANVLERFGKLDILVGNAGILGDLRPLAHVTEEIWNDVMNINLTANWRLIRAFDPLLRESDSGRAIFVTSGVTISNSPYWGPYKISKAALESMVKLYAVECETSNVKVNMVDPGVVATEMRASAMPGEDPETIPTPESVTDIFIKLASKDYSKSAQREAA